MEKMVLDRHRQKLAFEIRVSVPQRPVASFQPSALDRWIVMLLFLTVHRFLLAEPAPSEGRGASRHDTSGSCDTERGFGLDVRGASRLNHRRRGWRRSPPLRRSGRLGWTITPPTGGPARSRRGGTRDSSGASAVVVCARRFPRARDADRIVPRAFAEKPPRPRGRPRLRSVRARSARASPPTRGRLP